MYCQIFEALVLLKLVVMMSFGASAKSFWLKTSRLLLRQHGHIAHLSRAILIQDFVEQVQLRCPAGIKFRSLRVGAPSILAQDTICKSFIALHR